MSADASPPSDAENLQFDRAVDPSAADASDGAPVCATCNAAIRMYYYDVDGATVCSSCKQAVERSNGGGTGAKGGMLKIVLSGLGAAMAGAVIYYSVMEYLDLEIGYVAILIGFMVGYAIRATAAGRGGRRYQILAAGLTYFAVAMAYAPFALRHMGEDAVDTELSADSATAADTSSLTSATTDDAASATDAAVADGEVDDDATASLDESEPVAHKLGIGAVALLVGGGVLFVLALPVIVILGSMPSGLISALIIGIGMRQAWQMTGGARVAITGPFKVGGARPTMAA